MMFMTAASLQRPANRAPAPSRTRIRNTSRGVDHSPVGRVKRAKPPLSRRERDAVHAAVVIDQSEYAAKTSTEPDVWGALLDGRLTIVDRFERAGHRYLVARRDDGVERTLLLSERE